MKMIMCLARRYLLFVLLVLGCAAVFLATPVLATNETTTGRFTLDQIWGLQWASDPQISPNGKQVAFLRSSYDIMKDNTQESLWIVNSNGSNLRPLTDPDINASSPLWSPDGERLLYVVHSGKQAEIRVRWIKTGETARLATLQSQPREIAWSPDGDQIAFATFVPGKQHDSIANMPAKPKGADWAAPAMVIDRMNYRFNGQGYLPYGHTQLFVMPSMGGSPRQLTFGDFDNGGSLTWSRDSKELVFSANRNRPSAYHPEGSEIYRLSVAGGEPQALTDMKGPAGAPAVSPDGSKIAFTGYVDRGKGFHQTTHLYVMDTDGSNQHPVTENFDRDVSNPQWDHSGQGLYFDYVDQGITKLGYVTLGGKVTTIADIPGGGIDRPYSFGGYSLSPATGMFAFALSAPDHPSDVAVGRRSGSKAEITRLTDFSSSLLSHDELGKLETIHFSSSYDNRSIEGWVLTPPGFNPSEKYPLILEIHGGPSLSYGPTFSADDQVYAGAGYVVLYVNPRGSTSYGSAFADLINRDYPDHDYDDLMSGVDALIKRGYIDTQRMYVTGGSGGGVLTAWIVGHTRRFRAAVVVKPVINWYSWVLTADMGYTGMKYWMEGYPWKNLQRYMERSPISYVGNVETPTMLIHGEVDYRTPAPSAIQFYRALKMRRIPTVLVRIPGASHEIAARPSNMIAKIAYKLGWFACYGGQSVGKQVCPYADGRNPDNY